MRLTVAPFEPARHLDAAAVLLAARHSRDRARDERLPAVYEVPPAARAQIEQALAGHNVRGVVALDGPDVAGFMLASAQVFADTHFLASFFTSRGIASSLSSHAAREGLEYDAYREMFAVIADEFVAQGYFEFGITVPARDAATADALSSLGFGRRMAAAVRNVEPVRAEGAPVDVHLAGPEDADVVMRLSEELMLHHSRSPIFNPYIRESDEASHEMQKGLLQDLETNAHVVAYKDGKPLGMNTFMPPHFLSPMNTPDKTVYLFQGIVTGDARAGGVGTAVLAKGVEWARSRGFEYIGLHFATPNLSGARFWQANGFVPVEYTMRRHVDERIAWAHS